jgi:hypothetical protein
MQTLDFIITHSRKCDSKIKLFENSEPSIQHYLETYINNGSFKLTINQIYDAYFQGKMIRLNNLRDSWRTISILSRKLEIFFNFKVNVNLYLTPK